jgi:hypothetical protein
MRLGHLIGATSNATAARCRGSLASSLSKIAPILSKTASVQVGSDLFGQTKTLKGVALRPTPFRVFVTLCLPKQIGPLPGERQLYLGWTQNFFESAQRWRHADCVDKTSKRIAGGEIYGIS